MSSMTSEAIVRRAADLAKGEDRAGAVDKLIATVGADRPALEAARDQVAPRLHTHIDDFEATATLTLLNRVLARLPRTDPLDWRERWGRHRKP